jgi:hypothetical protein
MMVNVTTVGNAAVGFSGQVAPAVVERRAVARAAQGAPGEALCDAVLAAEIRSIANLQCSDIDRVVATAVQRAR